MNPQSILVYDLETTSSKVSQAIPRIMGFYSSKCEGFQWTTSIPEMVQIIAEHDVIVGYNNRDYDNEIMKRYGSSFSGKVIIDCMNIIHGSGFGNDLGRKSVIMVGKKHLSKILHGKSLADTTKALGGPLKIGDFDYNLFKKEFDELTSEERAVAIEYLQADLDATKYIYEFLENFFGFFRDGGIDIPGLGHRPFMRPEWIAQKKYLNISVGSWVYHAVCNMAGMDPEFQNGVDAEDYEGGFVRHPIVEKKVGRIRCKDYTSAYPFAYMQGNLFGRVQAGQGWKGQGICSTVGTYAADDMHIFTKILRQVFNQRYAWKQVKDPREYTLKIIINTFYGICGNPAYKHLYDPVIASDCTGLVRQWIKAANQTLTDAGYEVLYGDTDSLYVFDPFEDDARLDKYVQQHIKEVKSEMNFPQDDFDMSTDDEIKMMAFFKGTDGIFKKKNYLYVTEDNELKIKGLPIIKSNATPLGKRVFEKYIEPTIISTLELKFPRSQIEKWIEQELLEDIKLASVFYKIKEVAEYAVASQLQAQVARHKLYGPGQHNLLKLKVPHAKGCGTQQNYVGVQYADEVKFSMLDLTKTWQELDPFIKNNQVGLGSFF